MAVIKIFETNNVVEIYRDGSFDMLIPKRVFRIEPETSYIGLWDDFTRRDRKILYSEIVDKDDVPVGNREDVIEYLSKWVGFNAEGTSGGNPSVSNPIHTAQNYDDLVLTKPLGDFVGQISYVIYPQGTPWLYGNIGGTYYPKGHYVWDGVKWLSDKNLMSNQLQDLLETKLSSLSGFGVDNTDPLNPVIIDSHSQDIINNSISINNNANSITNNTNLANSKVSSVTGFGVDNTDDKNPVIQDVHGSQISTNTTNIGNNTALANSKVASVTGYNVNNTDPKNPVIEDKYEIRWDSFSILLSNTWTIVALPGLPANRIVGINVATTVNNTTVGVDNANGVLPKGLRIDSDSTAFFTAKTNASGEIEVYSSNALVTSFYVESYKN